MLSEEALVNLIIQLEAKSTVDDDSYLLDEGEQAALAAYYEILDRFLNKAENKIVKALRKEYERNHTRLFHRKS